MLRKSKHRKKQNSLEIPEFQNILNESNEYTINTNSENEELKPNISNKQNNNKVQISRKEHRNCLSLNENSSIKEKNIENSNENNNINSINTNDNNNNYSKSTKNIINNNISSTTINSNINFNKNNNKLYLNKKTKNLSNFIDESDLEKEEKKPDINTGISLLNSNISNNINQILNKTPLISMSDKEYNSECIPFGYLNEIWINLIEKEKENIYSYSGIIETQNDINSKMRAILVDYLISGQYCFYQKPESLFLAVNLIDRYISHKNILRSKFQLLGISALYISCKYEELFPRNINDFVSFSGNCAKKEEIVQMEKDIMNLVKFNLDLSISIDFYDILSTIYKFTKKEYYFGLFFLEAFLLEITCTSYKQSIIALGGCYIVLSMRQNNFEGTKNFLEYYSELNKININIWKEINEIKNCSKKMYFFL